MIHDCARFPQYLPSSRIMVGCRLALCLNYRRSYTAVTTIARHWWLVLAAFLAVHLVLFKHCSRLIALAYAQIVTPVPAPVASSAPTSAAV